MATAKRKGNKQPIDDPALEQATDKAVDQAEDEAKTGNVETADSPEETVDISYQGHSHTNP